MEDGMKPLAELIQELWKKGQEERRKSKDKKASRTMPPVEESTKLFQEDEETPCNPE